MFPVLLHPCLRKTITAVSKVRGSEKAAEKKQNSTKYIRIDHNLHDSTQCNIHLRESMALFANDPWKYGGMIVFMKVGVFCEVWVSHCREHSVSGDSLFLRNVGIYLRVYRASQPRRTTSLRWWRSGANMLKVLQQCGYNNCVVKGRRIKNWMYATSRMSTYRKEHSESRLSNYFTISYFSGML
jgi:hypothetical protein